MTLSINSTQSHSDAVGVSPSRTGPTDEELDQLWHKADILEEKVPQADRDLRGSERIPFRRRDVELNLQSERGCRQWRTVTRDLSSTGIGLFTRGFVYVGTRCELVLPRHLGGHDLVVGNVVWCDHLASTWHHVGIEFDTKIFPLLYLSPEESKKAPAVEQTTARLSGPVLVLDPISLDRQLLAFHLTASGAEPIPCATVADAEEAAAAIASGDCPMASPPVLADVEALAEAQNIAPADVFAQLEDRYGDSLIVLEKTENACQLSPKNVLKTPFTKASTAAAVAELLGGAAGDDTAIKSNLIEDGPPDGDLADLLDAAVRRIQSVGTDLQASVANRDLHACRAACDTLKTLGQSFGYAPLTTAADSALRALDATLDLSMSTSVLAQLRSVCRRVAR
ncbi:MAG: PilZ domain-containing protein [Planctomycetota bacterium]